MTEAAATDLPSAVMPASPRSGAMRLLSDERLARRATKGETDALGEIYRRYHQDLYRFCLAMVGNPEDGQEALQNTMLKVVRALPGEQRHIRLRPWLYRIARNEAVELLRRRREGTEPSVESMTAAEHVADTAEMRDRLRKLISDLEQLPERQRAALTMREMAGLAFEQIGDAFGTSAAVARQTVYEARLGLRQMEAGREMGCAEVTRALSDGDGRVLRRRDIRAHLRVCESCRAFRDGIGERHADFAAIAPLPMAASVVVLKGILGGGAGFGKAVTASAIVKSAATVAVLATVGVTVADRGGLIDTPVIGGGSKGVGGGNERGGAAVRPDGLHGAPRVGGPVLEVGGTQLRRPAGARDAMKQAVDGKRAGGADGNAGTPTSPANPPDAHPSSQGAAPPGGGHGRHRGKPDSLPAAAQHGQQTAAAHKAPQPHASPGPPQGAGGSQSAGNPSKPAPQPHAAGPPHKEAPGPPALPGEPGKPPGL